LIKFARNENSRSNKQESAQMLESIRKANAISRMVSKEFEAGNLNKCIELIRDELVLRKQEHDIRGEVNALQNLGRVHDELKRWNEAVADYQEAYGLARSLEDPSLLARLTSAIATVLYRSGELRGSLDYYMRAFSHYEHCRNLEMQVQQLSSIGFIQLHLNMPHEAKTSLNKARELFAESPISDRVRAVVMSSLASASETLGELLEAIKSYEQAKQLFLRCGEHELAGKIQGKLLFLLKRSASTNTEKPHCA